MDSVKDGEYGISGADAREVPSAYYVVLDTSGFEGLGSLECNCTALLLVQELHKYLLTHLHIHI